MIQTNTAINNDLLSLFDKSIKSNSSNTLLLKTYVPALQFQGINYKNKGVTEEIFIDIKGYEGHYQISNKGRIKSFNRNAENIIKSSIDKTKGYYRVCLYNSGKRKSFYIHQLVAIAFLGHIPNGNSLVVDHINNDKANNELSNLQVISSRENSSKDKWRHNPSSLYPGVYYSLTKKKWASSISVNGTPFHLGYFNIESIAGQEYSNALGHYSEHSNLTNFTFKTKRRGVYETYINQLAFVFSTFDN